VNGAEQTMVTEKTSRGNQLRWIMRVFLIPPLGGKQICECCFEAVENAVLQRMEDIIPWFTRILQARERQTEAIQRLIAQLRETLQQTENPADQRGV